MLRLCGSISKWLTTCVKNTDAAADNKVRRRYNFAVYLFYHFFAK